MREHLLALHLAAVVDSSADAIISEDLDGVVLSWNRAAERLFGYPPQEIIGRSIRVLIPLDRQDEEDLELARIRAGVWLAPFDTVRIHRDGHLVPVTVSVSPVLNENGVVIGGAKIARDLSPRLESDEALRAAHQRLLALIAASRILSEASGVAEVWQRTVALAHQAVAADAYAVWRLEQPDRWAMVYSQGLSDAFTRRVVTMDAAQSERSMRLLTKPFVVDDVATAPLVAESRDLYRLEGIRSMAVFPLQLEGGPGGTLIFYFRQPRVLSDLQIQTGQALANLAAVAIRTAELHQAQRRSAESAAYASRQAEFMSRATELLNETLEYQQTLASLAELAVPYYADWCAVDMLDAAGDVQRLAVSHVDPARVETARRLQERYPPNPDVQGGVHEVLRTGQAVMMSRIPPELLERAAVDAEHLALIREFSLTSYICVPLVTRRGVLGAISFLSAESAREYTEQDLTFAKEIARRAGLAIENALAYGEAKEASRMKDEFLATLSHEIRTPLNAVMGYIRMLRSGTIPDDRRANALEVVERNATALHQIVEDVLDIARLTSGKLRLESRVVSLAAIVREAVSTVEPTAEAKGVHVQLSVDGPDAKVMGDPNRLQQVFWNLLQNAVKFTPGGGEVHVTMTAVDHLVSVSVADTGKGITPAFLPHVFTRFRQEYGGTAGTRGGLGLGLAIVKDLTELHGGQVRAASEGPNKGATFVVTLPTLTELRVAPGSGTTAVA